MIFVDTLNIIQSVLTILMENILNLQITYPWLELSAEFFMESTFLGGLYIYVSVYDVYFVKTTPLLMPHRL